MRKMVMNKVGCYFQQHLVQQLLGKCPPSLQLPKADPVDILVMR
nr:hypothetical protein Q903MT_gene3177 [Picea sitchensis]